MSGSYSLMYPCASLYLLAMVFRSFVHDEFCDADEGDDAEAAAEGRKAAGTDVSAGAAASAGYPAGVCAEFGLPDSQWQGGGS